MDAPTKMPLSAEQLAAIISGETAPDADALAALMAADPATTRAIITSLSKLPVPARLARSARAGGLRDFPAELPRDAISAQAYWWGWNLYLPEPVMKQINGFGATAGGIAELLAAASAAGLIAASVAPLAAMVAAGIAIRWGVMALMDQGNGIKLASPWPCPVLMTPLPIDA